VKGQQSINGILNWSQFNLEQDRSLGFKAYICFIKKFDSKINKPLNKN